MGRPVTNCLITFTVAFLLCQTQLRSQAYKFSEAQGLLDNKYNSFVTKDSRGYVWIGSPKGITIITQSRVKHILLNEISKFEGYTDIQSNFYEDHITNIWFTTYDALVKFDRETSQFQKFKMQHNGIDLKDEYHLFHIDNVLNELWLAASDKLFKVHVTEPHIQELIADSILGRRFIFLNETASHPKSILGLPWIEKTGYEEFQFNNDIVTRIYMPNLVAEDSIITTKLSRGIVINRTLWTPSKIGLIEYDLSIKKVIHVHKNAQWIDFFDVVSFNSHTLILSAKNNGIVWFDLNKKSFYQPKNISSLSEDLNARQLFMSKDRQLWVSNFEQGLFMIDLKSLEPEMRQRINLPVGQSFSYIKAIADHIFVGRNSGILNLIDSEIKIMNNMKTPDGLNVLEIKQQNEQYFWCRTIDNLHKIDIKASSFAEKIGIPYQQIFDFKLNDSSGQILGASDVFMAKKNRSSWEIQKDFSLSQENKNILTIHTSPDKTIYSHDAKYLWLLDHKNKTDTTYDIGSEINDILFSKQSDKILIAAKNGLYQINSTTLEIQKRLDKPYQVGDNEVYRLAEIQDVLWVFDTISMGKWDQTSGTFLRTPYPDMDPGPNSFRITCSDDDKFWFCGSNTLIKIDANQIQFDTSKTYIHIHEIIINDIRLESDTSYNFINTLKLNHQQNTLSLDVSAIDNYPNKGSYVQYRLMGYDTIWQYDGGDELIQFSNLQPDNYTLELIPIRSSGVKGHPKSISIQIEPPYWQTWWFRISVGLSLIGLGWLVSYLIIRRKILQQKIQLDRQKALSDQRERLADDLHDELGTELSKILYLSDEASYISDVDKKEELLQDISKMATSSIRNMRDLLWVMDEKNGSLDDLLMRLKKSVAQTLISYPITLIFDLPEETPYLILTAIQRQHLMLLTKEVVHNIIKHSEASTVKVNAQIIKDHLNLKISDNGSGFDPEQHGLGGKGMRSLQKRAMALRGNLQINSNPKEGTTITLECPLT